MGVIEVAGIRIYAYHGCLPEEAKIGGEYIVDVIVENDMEKAIESDELSSTVDYCSVTKIVAEQMAIRSKLIEHVGGRIITELRARFPSAAHIEVKVSKLAPPIKGNVERVSVTLAG